MKWPSRVRIYHLSRDSNFLWKVVIGILGVCTLLGAVAGQLGGRAGSTIPIHSLENLGSKPPADEVLDAIQTGSVSQVLPLVAHPPKETPEAEIEAAIQGSTTLSTSEKQLVLAVAASSASESPTPELEQIAAERPPRRYANEMLGYLLEDSDPARAAAAYEVEGRAFPDASRARAMAIELYREIGKADEVRRLMEEPSFRDEINTGTALKLAWEQGEWLRFPGILLEREWHERSPLAVIMTVVAGLVWVIIGLHLAQAPLLSMRTVICLIALVLGYFSGVAVLIAGFIKEDVHGFTEGKNFIENLIFFVIGVGVPEETCKLLLFIPLVPWLVARKEPLEMLMAASFTGLGFAIAENLSYIEGFGAPTALERFLTANFLHMSLTGLIGGAFCQMFYYRRGLEKFLTLFIFAILLHGAYDAVLGLEEGGFFALVMLVGASYLFFHQLRADRPIRQEPISPIASFAVGSAVVIGMAIIVASYQMGFSQGLSAAGLAALSVAVLNVVFVRELGTL